MCIRDSRTTVYALPTAELLSTLINIKDVNNNKTCLLYTSAICDFLDAIPSDSSAVKKAKELLSGRCLLYTSRCV